LTPPGKRWKITCERREPEMPGPSAPARLFRAGEHRIATARAFATVEAMKPVGRKTILAGLVLVAAVLGVILAVHIRNPYGRLDRLGRAVERLGSAYPRPYGPADYVVGIRHRTEPFDYYCQELDREERRLLASGHLVWAEFPLPEGKTVRDVLLSLRQEFLETGAYFRAIFDRTNGVVRVVCKPKDVAAFKAVLANR
jgi:hypothetical protein